MKKNTSKIEHLWSIVCLNSSIDYETNNVSIFNILEDLQFIKDGNTDLREGDKTIIPVNFQLISLWRKNSENEELSVEVKLELVDPKGEVLGALDYGFLIPGDKKRMRQRVNIPTQIITTSGEYFYKVNYRINGEKEFKHVYSVPLVINLK